MKQILLGLSILIFLSGCKPNMERSNDVDTEDVVPFNASRIDAHNSRNSQDWEGAYSGVLPCEECLGIDTYVKINRDHTYALIQRHLDRDDVISEEKKTEGTFFWNEEGSSITFESIQGEISNFRVHELFLTPLNKNGMELRPEPGNNFKLLKQ